MLKSARDLHAAGLIAEDAVADVAAVAERYAVAVTPAVAALIEAAPDDPIARQFVPAAEELIGTPDERADPIGDAAHSPVKGIVHRYADRVLLAPVQTCATYCRYCFRREAVGQGAAPLSEAELDAALEYVRARPEIWEVILTGGDPFVLSPRRLRRIVEGLGAIEHLGAIRVHTRVPVVDPARVDDTLVAALDSDKAVHVVVHCNHARELTPAAVAATRRLIDAGIPVLSQSVLLKGVNDDAGTLEALFRALVRARIRPYYLHHPDRAPGTAHFRVSLAEGRALVDGLRGRVSGLCQPAYVLDIPGGHGKVPAGAAWIDGGEDGRYAARDPLGIQHTYVEASGSFAPDQAS